MATKMDPRLLTIMHLLETKKEFQALYSQERAALRRIAETSAPSQNEYPSSLFHGVQEVTNSIGGAELFFDVLIKFKGHARHLGNRGVKGSAVLGDIAIAQVSREVLNNLASDRRVLFIELSRPAHRQLDHSVEAIGARQWPAQSSDAATGKGTVIGVIDLDGLDFHHPDFQNGDRTTRLLSLWDQRGEFTPGTLQLGIKHPWKGVVYTAQDINTDLSSIPYSRVNQVPVKPNGNLSHSTHVTGIAAGNGAVEARYKGVAPDAEIIYVNTTSSYVNAIGDFSAVARGILYIFEHATRARKPCVINLSIGDNLGPHDGTSLVERFIDYSLATPDRAVVVAAGNYNNRYKHAKFTLPGKLDLQFTTTHCLSPSSPRASKKPRTLLARFYQDRTKQKHSWTRRSF